MSVGFVAGCIDKPGAAYDPANCDAGAGEVADRAIAACVMAGVLSARRLPTESFVAASKPAPTLRVAPRKNRVMNGFYSEASQCRYCRSVFTVALWPNTRKDSDG